MSITKASFQKQERSGQDQYMKCKFGKEND